MRRLWIFEEMQAHYFLVRSTKRWNIACYTDKRCSNLTYISCLRQGSFAVVVSS